MSGVAKPSTRIRKIDRVVTALLFFGTVGWLLAVEGRQGIGRDEAQYMRAGERYWGWFGELGDNLAAGHPNRSFTAAGIDRYWSDNAPDHPVVMKVLFGVSWRLFRAAEDPDGAALHPVAPTTPRGTLPIFARPSTAFRFPAILVAGLMAALVFVFARRFMAVPAAAAASVMAIAQPHYFFHAPIACFDAPITMMALAVGYAYWRSLTSPRWGIVAGVLFGVALGIKHNAWLMPIFLLAHYLWMRRKDLRRLRPPRVPLAFAAMLFLGPIIFYLHWPWLWVNPELRAKTYVNRHLQHEHYNFEYLGRNWNNPPRDTDLKVLRMTFPFVSTALTMPVTTLALAVAGGVVLLRRRRRDAGDEPLDQEAAPVLARPSWLRPGADVDRAPGAFFAVQIFGPLAVLAVPASPIFGGVKHFMPAFPFIAIAAGLGVEWLGRQLLPLVQKYRSRLVPSLPVALAAMCSLPAVVETRRSHPDGLSHYNLLAGGFAGGAEMGMNRQFWGYSVFPMLGFIEKNAPASANTYWHDVMGDALNMYVRDGSMRPGLGNTGVGEDAIRRSDLGLIIHEKHMLLYEGVFWESYGTTRPVAVRSREGVPLVTIYRRPGAR
jgi:hypothetical protein